MASGNLLLQAREVHAQWLASKKAVREGFKDRAEEEEAARAAPRYETESFDISSGCAPEVILRRALSIPAAIQCARSLVDEHVFGETRSWMHSVADELASGVGTEFIANVFWWQVVLDHIQLRAQRVADSVKRESALPLWQRTHTPEQLTRYNRTVPLSAVINSNCIEVESALNIDLDDGGDSKGDGDDGGEMSSGGSNRNIAQRLLERARRIQTPLASSRAPPSSGIDDADADMPPECPSSPPSSRARSPRRTSTAMRQQPSAAHGGLPGLFKRLSAGYRALFLTITQTAARAGKSRRGSSSSSSERDDSSPIAARAYAQTASALLELSAAGSLRDRACSYFRALLIETVVCLFHSAYAGSASLSEGLMLHFPVLRERVVRSHVISESTSCASRFLYDLCRLL
jgi:hypothetical protein